MSTDAPCDRISYLTNHLTTETKVTARRKLADELYSKLADPKIRSKIKAEALAVASKASSDPKHAIRKFYRAVMNASIHASKLTLSSKSKCVRNDVNLPWKILRCIDAESDQVAASMKQSQQQSSYPIEPFTYDSFYTYRDTNARWTNLSSKEIEALVQYVLCYLENEHACAVAEDDLLALLGKLCSRSDYVIHFSSKNYVREICGELGPRIARPNSGVIRGGKASVSAARAFANLIHHGIVTLGVNWSTFARPSLHLVVDWIDTVEDSNARSCGKNHTLHFLQYMYGVVVDVLAVYPDQSVTILANDGVGKKLLGFARKMWRSTRATSLQRDVLVQYFSAHLLVCEVAGELQGLMPGDLGNMGSASLDSTKIHLLLKLILCERNLEALFASKIGAHVVESKEISHKKRRRAGGIKIKPLSKRERRYLELAARLLRCAQRFFLSDAELRSSTDPTASLLDEHERMTDTPYSGLDSGSTLISVDALSSCPWLTYVAKYLPINEYSAATGESTSSISKSFEDLSPLTPEFSYPDSRFSPEKSQWISNLPMTMALINAKKYSYTLNNELFIPYIHIISACAELFPRGECWSSTNKWHRTNFSPLKSHVETRSKIPTYCNVCSPNDMASIVYSLSVILSSVGNASGDITIQMSTIVCLLKLTEASAIICRYWEKDNAGLEILGLAWRGVCTKLFRSDLRYTSYTADASQSSPGELVLMLLTEVTRAHLTEPSKLSTYLLNDRTKGAIVSRNIRNQALSSSFMYTYQDHVWNLPAFNFTLLVKSSAPFELATAIIHCVGLSEGETDAMDTRELTGFLKERLKIESPDGNRRRYRIAGFCLKFVQQAIKSNQTALLRRIIPFASTCFSSLIGASRILTTSSYSMQAFRTLRFTEDRIGSFEFSSPFDSCHRVPTVLELDDLWEDAMMPFAFQYRVENNTHLWDALHGRDVRLCPEWSIDDRKWLKRKFLCINKVSSDFVSCSMSKSILEFGLLTITDIIQHCDGGNEESVSCDDDKSFDDTNTRISAVKMVIALSLCVEGERSNCVPWRLVEDSVNSICNEVVAKLKTVVVETEEFAYILSDLLGILKVMKECHILEGSAFRMKKVLSREVVSKLYSECYRLLKQYTTETFSNSGKQLDMFDANSCEENERENEIHPNKRKKSDSNNYSDREDYEMSSVRKERKRSTIDRASESSSDSEGYATDDNTKSSRQQERKRKYPSAQNQSYPSLTRSKQNSAPDSKDAWLCASVILLLDESTKCCQKVSDAMIWPCEVTGFLANHEPHDSLLFASLICSYTSCEEKSGVSEVDSNGDAHSKFFLCTQSILKGRSEAHDPSPFHMFGFQSCEKLMSKRAQSGWSIGLHDWECEGLLALLYPEDSEMLRKCDNRHARRSLEGRPHLRSLQIQSATECFLLGDCCFHKQFDSIFAQIFVVPSLHNESPLVRHAGVSAVAAALKLLPFQDKIKEDALQSLVPLPSFVIDGHTDSAFSKWAKSICCSNAANEEKRAWKERRLSLESDAVMTLAVLGGSTSDSGIMRKIVMDFVQLSTIRSELVGLCFRSLEQLAHLCSFAELEDLLRVEQEWLLHNWVKSRKALLSMPLCLCSPCLVRNIMRLNNYFSEINDAGSQSERNILDINKLHNEIACEYISQTAPSLIPIILIVHSEETLEKHKDNSDNGSYRWQYLQQASNALVSGCTDDHLANILRGHLHDIYAFIFPMLQNDCCDGKPIVAQSRANNIVQFLGRCLPEETIKKQAAKKAHLVIRQLLKLSGKDIIYYDDVKMKKGAYVGAIYYIAKEITRSKENLYKGDVFQNAGTSITECFLHARQWLDFSTHSIEREQAWQAIGLILDEAVRLACDVKAERSQLGFCLSTMLSIVVDERNTTLRCSILSKIEYILNLTLDEKIAVHNKAEIGYVLNQFCSALVQIHVESQSALVDYCLSSWKIEKIKTRLGNGIKDMIPDLDSSFDTAFDSDNDENNIKLSLEAHLSEVSHITECLIKVYDILNFLLLRRSSLFIDKLNDIDPFPSSTTPIEELEILSRCNEKFCLTDLFTKFEKNKVSADGSNFFVEVENFLSLSKRFRIDNSITKAMQRREKSREPEASSCLSALNRLRKLLHDRSRMNREDIDVQEKRILYNLLNELFTLSSSHFSTDVQDATSRCLGEIALDMHQLDFTVVDITSNSNDFVHTQVDFSSDPLLQVKTSALELLTKLIHSDDVETAIIAKDTLKAILMTEDGVCCCREIECANLKRIIFPLAKKKGFRGNRYDIPEITDTFHANLISAANTTKDNIQDDRSWCWSDKLWTCEEGGDLSFAEWAKNVVCALLLCCYKDPKTISNSNERQQSSATIEGRNNFFRLCAKICSREHRFAVILFPGIIFDLLVSDECDDSEIGQDRKDLKYNIISEVAIGVPFSLANQRLTHCFSNVLKTERLGENNKDYVSDTSIDKRLIRSDEHAVAMIVGVLDKLRHITEQRFYCFPHKRNLLAIPGRQYPEQVRQGRAPKIPKESYNKVDPSPSWGGRPYGVVLHLNGIELALSCLRAKKFVSALYYSEMYADNRLGGAGCVFDRLEENPQYVESKLSQHSISGFCIPIEYHKHYGGSVHELNNDIVGRAVSLQNILCRCLKALHETDGIEALENQISAIRFDQTNCHSSDFSRIASISKGNEIGKALLNLDMKVQSKNGLGLSNAEDRLAITSCLGNLGMRDTLRHYIVGLCQASECLNSATQIDTDTLKDKWAEETWRILQWDESLLSNRELGTTHIDVRRGNLQTFEKNANITKFCQRTRSISKFGFHEALSNSFDFLLKDDNAGFSNDISLTRRNLIEELRDCVAAESLLSGVSDFALKFHIINELEDLGSVIFGEASPKDWLNKWCSKSNFSLSKRMQNFSFNTIEFASASHEVALKILHHKVGEWGASETGLALCSHLWEVCSLSCLHGRPNIASAALERLRRCTNIIGVHENDNQKQFKFSMRFKLEEAKIAHCDGDTTAAVRTSKLIIRSIRRFQSEHKDAIEGLNPLLTETTLQCGEWLIGSKVDSAITILNDYLKPSAELAQTIHNDKNTLNNSKFIYVSNFQLAEFVANLYDSAEARVNSHEWKMFGIAAAGRQKELQGVVKLFQEYKRMFNSKRRSRERIDIEKQLQNCHIHMVGLQKEVENDQRERNAVEESLICYLRLAIESYGLALSCCGNAPTFTKHVFRLISLWFKNSHRVNDKQNINSVVSRSLDKIPSYQFVPLNCQIFSRIDKPGGNDMPALHDFQSVLRSLISKICIEHPYHGLVQLIALSNGNNVGTGVSGRQATEYLDNVGASKVEATKDILKSIKKRAPLFVSNLVSSYTILLDAYICLAMESTTRFVRERKTKDIPLSSIKHGVDNLDKIMWTSSAKAPSCVPCVLTQPPSIRPGADYGNGTDDPIGSERIASFDLTFSLTDTGIHRPKIINCTGKKGGRFKQLVKGEDDIRQDAIMQQVFTTVNFLLGSESASNKSSSLHCRRLKMVTYTCVPLSPTSGVLEWVMDTIPFGDYLGSMSRGKKAGAHARYYPGEWESSLCRYHFMNSPTNQQRATFDEICKHFSPAFRFFFLERFSHSLQTWHEARLSYVRSCAVNSIVGHILGIGDRHSHNILVHQKTGEVVHIDFGIVFEQGKTLTTPETVPFRMTRDIVDGMGPIGTDGAFTAAAEATTQVLRDNSSALLTILSAVVSDPLYKWCVNPLTARQRQRDNDSGEGNDDCVEKKMGTNMSKINMVEVAAVAVENENDAAARTIAKINEKLQGFEEGTLGERLTVEGQVRLLINAAKDRDNLCTMFNGWAPWL